LVALERRFKRLQFCIMKIFQFCFFIKSKQIVNRSLKKFGHSSSVDVLAYD
jgi:hypothetical protein